jgi:hypothetical protein
VTSIEHRMNIRVNDGKFAIHAFTMARF